MLRHSTGLAKILFKVFLGIFPELVTFSFIWWADVHFCTYDVDSNICSGALEGGPKNAHLNESQLEELVVVEDFTVFKSMPFLLADNTGLGQIMLPWIKGF